MINQLRPDSFQEFVGQQNLVNNLLIFIKSSKMQQKALDHILIHGPAGAGKTTLANVIAKEFDQPLKIVYGQNLTKQSDILSILLNLQPYDILFIDEFHSINKKVEETLYSVLEDNYLNLIIGKEHNQKNININIPCFTLIAATTKLGKLSKSMQDRFSITLKMNNYNINDIITIIDWSAKKLHFALNQDAINLLAAHARFTPRVANNLLKRVIDFTIVHQQSIITKPIIQDILDQLQIKRHGLNENDIHYLTTLYVDFKGQATGLASISYLMQEATETIEANIEPLLLRLNFILKTPKGRIITKQGINFINTYR